MNDNNLPYADHAIEISISIDDLRKATDTETKFPRPYDFKRKVMDIAIREINEKSKYHVEAKDYRRNHSVAGYDFLIESHAGYFHRISLQEQTNEVQLSGQMNIYDYESENNEFKITKG
jgi:plasmid replication initiation protein